MSSSPQPAHRDEENPLVTIGLVTLNEEKVIAGSLGALIDESRNINSEIVVVAGGTDRTIDIVSDSLLRARKSKLLVRPSTAS
jgi:glycosyltransferase involved in cell wall biosynthesis